MSLSQGIPGASSAVPLAGAGIARWSLPLAVPGQSVTVVWLLAHCRSPPCSPKEKPQCFPVSSEGCILPSHQGRQNQHFPVVHGFKITPDQPSIPHNSSAMVAHLYFFKFQLPSQEPTSLLLSRTSVLRDRKQVDLQDEKTS